MPIDYEAMRRTIATETSVEALRLVVVTLLGVVEARIRSLADVDPIEVSAYRPEVVEITRNQIGQIHALEVMRSVARAAFEGIEALDVQIERVRGRR